MDFSALSSWVSEFLGAVQGCDAVKSPDPQAGRENTRWLKHFGELRGRPLLYPATPGARGSGAYLEMSDGSVKLDMLSSLGVHLFGYQHPELLMAAFKALARPTLMQGTLMPSKEYARLLELLLQGARDLPHLSMSARARVQSGWLTTCGTMANEMALKVIRQKKAPAYKVIGFKNCFAGRSVTMQEITDEPKYREGQPLFDQVTHIPFFDPQKSVEQNVTLTCESLDRVLATAPHPYCCLSFEVVQGEGGAFRSAPREWWVAVLTRARAGGLALWFDEIQTFGRTGELFAFQRFELGEFVDVVTAAKPIECGATLWTEDYAPKAGLVAGTFAAHSVALAQGARVIEMLIERGCLGPQGSIQKLERFIVEDWKARKQRLEGHIRLGAMHCTGGMVAVEVLDGQEHTIKAFLQHLFSSGVIAFTAGRSPVMVRMLPPMGILTEEMWLKAMEIFEKSLLEFNKSHMLE